MRNQLERIFDQYNKKYFENKLPKVRVKYNKKLLRREDALGVFETWVCRCKGKKHPDTYCIDIATEVRFSGRWTKHVLLHECVHAKFLDKTDGMAHGPRFQKEMLRLAKAGAFRDLW